MKKLLLLTLFIIPFSLSYAASGNDFCNTDRGAPDNKVQNNTGTDDKKKDEPLATKESCTNWDEAAGVCND